MFIVGKGVPRMLSQFLKNPATNAIQAGRWQAFSTTKQTVKAPFPAHTKGYGINGTPCDLTKGRPPTLETITAPEYVAEVLPALADLPKRACIIGPGLDPVGHSLASLGYEVHVYDVSEDVLDWVRKAAKKLGLEDMLETHLVTGDKCPLPDRQAYIQSMYVAPYMSDKVEKEHIAAACDALEYGGRMHYGFYTPEHYYERENSGKNITLRTVSETFDKFIECSKGEIQMLDATVHVSNEKGAKTLKLSDMPGDDVFERIDALERETTNAAEELVKATGIGVYSQATLTLAKCTARE